jgi:hypothetical protein
MRLLLISCVVVCAGLAASPATAYYGSKRGYDSCYCAFGYPGPSCIPAVSCARPMHKAPRQHQ